ncbi:unnamed protein product, partial [Staurois parvus]
YKGAGRESSGHTPGQQRAGSEVLEEKAENGQGHKPGSVTSGQHGTEGQAEGWSGKPRVKQDTISRVRYNAEVGNGSNTGSGIRNRAQKTKGQFDIPL